MQKIRQTGMSFKGSKSKLAERIVSIFPRAEHFYDLFSGGCAIAHCSKTSFHTSISMTLTQ